METALPPLSPGLQPASLHLGGYFPCPGCGTCFKSLDSVADHIVVDHWWSEPPTTPAKAA